MADKCVHSIFFFQVRKTRTMEDNSLNKVIYAVLESEDVYMRLEILIGRVAVLQRDELSG